MSDGPYRSLPMSPKWKQAAKRAYLSSFSTPEVSEALQQAAERDCRAELSVGLVRRGHTRRARPCSSAWRARRSEGLRRRSPGSG